MQRQNIAATVPWARIVGYSRAVRVGPFVHVTGTIGCDESGQVIGEGDAYAQAVAAIRKIEVALRDAGATLADVVRTRIYVTDIDQWEKIGRAHAEYFADIKPATTMIEVSRLITPQAVVEIEADAVIVDAEQCCVDQRSV